MNSYKNINFLFETLDEVAPLINDKEKEEEIYSLVAQEKIAEAFSLIVSSGVDLDPILERKSREVSVLLFQM